MMNADPQDTDLESALRHSHEADAFERLASIPELRGHIDQPAARERLEQMLADDVVTVEVEAAEALVKSGGKAGLLAVLGVLGRRHDDPDVDYIAYMLNDIDHDDEFPVLQDALAIDDAELTLAEKLGLENLRRLMGR
ncbi:hypothetical protein ACIP5Y_06005 [Nocardia sp. NPDC088792]|uniref:hypothetical protein n=1 Tax=Nocardia sp. NPDC088792 TaxID=3364332 RepID=UPI00380C72FD